MEGQKLRISWKEYLYTFAAKQLPNGGLVGLGLHVNCKLMAVTADSKEMLNLNDALLKSKNSKYGTR